MWPLTNPPTAGNVANHRVSKTAANAPSVAPARLTAIDSSRIIRTTRDYLHPRALRTEISAIRSTTDMTIMLSIPITPTMVAMVEVSQATGGCGRG
jgi:hypothetical protein